MESSTDEEKLRAKLKKAQRPAPIPIGRAAVVPPSMRPPAEGKLVKFPEEKPS